MAKVTVSKKGWIVIPADLRKKHKIKPGDSLEINDDGVNLTLTPFKDSVVDKYAGFFKPFFKEQ